ncbi:MAG: BBE domain-containing protein [Dehalococcoidia bacterium]
MGSPCSAHYGRNYSWLVKLKTKDDPNEYFRMNQKDPHKSLNSHLKYKRCCRTTRG